MVSQVSKLFRQKRRAPHVEERSNSVVRKWDEITEGDKVAEAYLAIVWEVAADQKCLCRRGQLVWIAFMVAN